MGNSTIQCQDNGRWYPEKPQCLGNTIQKRNVCCSFIHYDIFAGNQCYAFKQPSYSTLTILSDSSYEDYKENITKFDPGTQIEINCNEKVTIEGEKVITCLENGMYLSFTLFKMINTINTFILNLYITS